MQHEEANKYKYIRTNTFKGCNFENYKTNRFLYFTPQLRHSKERIHLYIPFPTLNLDVVLQYILVIDSRRTGHQKSKRQKNNPIDFCPKQFNVTAIATCKFIKEVLQQNSDAVFAICYNSLG